MAPPATEMPRPPSLRVYTAQELAEATGGFSPFALIGEGGFGKVSCCACTHALCAQCACKPLRADAALGLHAL